jgi:glutamine amidotransferase
MCRVLGYLGQPVSLESILYETDSALVRQSYSPRMMDAFLNLAGFGMAAWDDRSVRGEEPFTYRVSSMPNYDRNLRSMCRKLSPTCLLAHVRGVTWEGGGVISDLNLHPFNFPGAGLLMAHNGHLRNFDAMRYDLLGHLPHELSRRIAGTTDSEWIYALLLAELGDRAADPQAADLVEATIAVLKILRDVRARRGIDTSSPINLFMATSRCLVATRFVMDYGWYPTDDPMLEVDLPYVSLWYTAGRSYVDHRDGWQMLASDGRPQSLMIASEPLTADTSTWLEVPEYSLLAVTREADGLSLETFDLDV